MWQRRPCPALARWVLSISCADRGRQVPDLLSQAKTSLGSQALNDGSTPTQTLPTSRSRGPHPLPLPHPLTRSQLDEEAGCPREVKRVWVVITDETPEEASTALELTGPQPSKAALGRPALLLAASVGKGEGGSDLLPGRHPRPGLWKLRLEIG